MSMRIVFRLNGWLVRALCILAVALIAAMMLGISAEVILRMFGFPSIIGLIELTEYALFISTFFVAPHLLRTNEHIRVDIVMSRVEPDAAKWVECGVLLTIMLISLVTGIVATMIMLRLDHPAHVGGHAAAGARDAHHALSHTASGPPPGRGFHSRHPIGG
jgi:TRAP-type transport system small permease protein